MLISHLVTQQHHSLLLAHWVSSGTSSSCWAWAPPLMCRIRRAAARAAKSAAPAAGPQPDQQQQTAAAVRQWRHEGDSAFTMHAQQLPARRVPLFLVQVGSVLGRRLLHSLNSPTVHMPYMPAPSRPAGAAAGRRLAAIPTAHPAAPPQHSVQHRVAGAAESRAQPIPSNGVPSSTLTGLAGLTSAGTRPAMCLRLAVAAAGCGAVAAGVHERRAVVQGCDQRHGAGRVGPSQLRAALRASGGRSTLRTRWTTCSRSNPKVPGVGGVLSQSDVADVKAWCECVRTQHVLCNGHNTRNNVSGLFAWDSCSDPPWLAQTDVYDTDRGAAFGSCRLGQ